MVSGGPVNRSFIRGHNPQVENNCTREPGMLNTQSFSFKGRNTKPGFHPDA